MLFFCTTNVSFSVGALKPTIWMSKGSGYPLPLITSLKLPVNYSIPIDIYFIFCKFKKNCYLNMKSNKIYPKV